MIRINSMHISMVYLWVSMAIPMCMALMSIVCKIDPPLQLYGIAGEDVFTWLCYRLCLLLSLFPCCPLL